MDKMSVDLPRAILTARLILRSYQPGDAADYLRLCLANKQHLLPFEAGNPALGVQTAADAERLVQDYAAAWAARTVFFMGGWEQATGTLVAQIVLMVVNWELPEFAVGYFVDVGHVGRGYVTEGVRAVLGLAFGRLGAHRVRLECNETNTGSVRVAERCGFVREGYLRQTHKNILRGDGTPSGDYIYGMLRAEYVARYGLPAA